MLQRYVVIYRILVMSPQLGAIVLNMTLFNAQSSMKSSIAQNDQKQINDKAEDVFIFLCGL